MAASWLNAIIISKKVYLSLKRGITKSLQYNDGLLVLSQGYLYPDFQARLVCVLRVRAAIIYLLYKLIQGVKYT